MSVAPTTPVEPQTGATPTPTPAKASLGLWLLGLMAAGLVVRAWYTSLQGGLHYPDAIFQYLEPPWAMMHGDGWMPWEFVRGARNWLIPWHYGALMGLGDLFGLRGLDLYHLLWAHNVLLSLAIIPAGYRLGRAMGRGDGRLGLLVAGAFALFPTFGVFAPHTLSEGHALVFTTWAYALWMEQVVWPGAAGGRRRAFAIGVLLGGVFIARVSLAVFLPLVLLDYLGRRRWAHLAAGSAGFLAAMAVLGLSDWVAWGTPFQSIIEYVKFNWVEGGAARLEVKPRGWYWETLFLERLGAATWLVVAANAAALWRHWRMVLAWVLPLVALSALGIKQERFLLTIWPFVLAGMVGGLWELSRWVPRARWAPAAVAVALVCAFNVAGLRSMEQLRWKAGVFAAQDWIGRQGTATGVLHEAETHIHGGKTLLGEAVPMVRYRSALRGHRLFNFVIAESERLTKGLGRDRHWRQAATFEQGVVVFERVDGWTARAPDAPTP